MNERRKRKLMLLIAMSYHGTFYTWGGDDPSGFDCSGLAIEVNKSVGNLPRKGDWRAKDLYKIFMPVEAEKVKAGDLVFWGSPISHVEICLNRQISIGASGGGSAVVDLASAIKANAFIKFRPIHGRGKVAKFCNPFIRIG